MVRISMPLISAPHRLTSKSQILYIRTSLRSVKPRDCLSGHCASGEGRNFQSLARPRRRARRSPVPPLDQLRVPPARHTLFAPQRARKPCCKLIIIAAALCAARASAQNPPSDDLQRESFCIVPNCAVMKSFDGYNSAPRMNGLNTHQRRTPITNHPHDATRHASTHNGKRRARRQTNASDTGKRGECQSNRDVRGSRKVGLI